VSALARKRTETAWEEDVAVPLAADFTLASGDVLGDGHVLIRLAGVRGAPVVGVLGGISAGRNVAGSDGWWSEVAGPGAAIDLNRYTVLGVEFAPLNDRRVRITPDDQARLIELALDALDIAQLHAFVGASYGGMVGLALASRAPARVRRLCIISASHRPSALGLAWRGIQRRIVEFGLAHGDGERGLALARQLAMTTYRSPEEFEARFGAGVDADGRGSLDAYLIARGEAYPRQIPPQRWLSLSEAIDRHTLTPEAVRVPVTLAACPNDQLVPFADVNELARRLPQVASFHALNSIFGHDAFLKETEAVSAIIRQVLESEPNV